MEMISAFVDQYSKHLVKNLQSYVQDSPHFLRILEEENLSGPRSMNTFLVTIDVTALYTSIPASGESGGIKSFENALNHCPPSEQIKMPTNFLIECLDAVLSGNMFFFNDDLFIQKIGTAMGTRVAPTYACLFMGEFETVFLQAKWNGVQPNLWKRYIDNIWFLWNDTIENLELFMKEINSHHDYIKFTANYDTASKLVPFLVMQVSIDKNCYSKTDLYEKETAKVTYLLPSSCHPSHVTCNILLNFFDSFNKF